MSNKNSAIGFFIAAFVAGTFTVFSLISGLIRMTEVLPNEIHPADRAGQYVGRLSATGWQFLLGVVITLAFYSAAMARMFPRTHSSAGKLNQIYDATKNFEITDRSEDGFYRNATDQELFSFFRRLSETTDSPKLNALVLEVRRRVGVAAAE
ncbi:MAG: hypothetical protein R3C03_20600 [Pirellulaceae bacterium]